MRTSRAPALVLWALAACGPSSPPAAPRPCPPEAPAPLATVVIGSVEARPPDRWESPARLVSQRISGSERHRPTATFYETRGEWIGHEGASVMLQPDGLRLVVLKQDTLSMWAREPGGSTWTQILHEAWLFRSAAWEGNLLELCRKDKRAIRGSLGPERADWQVIEKADCKDVGRVSRSQSSAGRWTAKVTRRSECVEVRMSPSVCTYFNDAVIEGPGAPPKRLQGGATDPALSPSGRFFAFEDVKGPVMVYETSSRTLRTTRIQKTGGNGDRILWLPDESAFGVVSAGGGVDFVSPVTGAVLGGIHGRPVPETAVVLDRATGEPHLAKDWRKDHVSAAKGSIALPEGAERRWSFPGTHRTSAFGKGTWALWDDDSGKALRIVQDVVSAEPSPSQRFIALLRDRCDKPIVCGASVEVVEAASGLTRHTLDLTEVTLSSAISWLGPAEREILAVVERDAQLLRLSDGAILHVEPPTLPDAQTPVLWTESGLTDGSPAELATWVFRPAGRLDRVFGATLLRHPGLWRDFGDGKELPAPGVLGEGRGP